jgi:hypothetical protein
VKIAARTAEDVLAERRSVVQEQRRERDPIARDVLQYQIDDLDRELATLRSPTSSPDLPRAPGES